MRARCASTTRSGARTSTSRCMGSFTASGVRVPFVRLLLLLLCAVPARGATLLAGEAVRFDPAPQFTIRQLRHTAAATRDGLARWAATPHGREILAFFDKPEYEVTVFEDDADRGAGNAPQPGLATLAA